MDEHIIDELHKEISGLVEIISTMQKKQDKMQSIINILVRPDRYVFERPIFGGAKGLTFSPGTNIYTPTGKQDKSGSGGSNVTDGTGYDGNIGTSYFTIGDIVYALKALGLLKL